MTRIIGHRGAAGLALENSLAGIKAALALPLAGLEIDVRRTQDGRLVLLHDQHTGRVATSTRWINDLPLAEAAAITLKNGEHLPTLESALQVVGSTMPLMLDLKDNDIADELLRLLDAHPDVRVSLTGRQYAELKKLHALWPNIPVFAQHHYDPIDIIHRAKSIGANGICLNMWLMNPLTYRLAKRYGLAMYVYSIDHRFFLPLFSQLYPDAVLISNHPDRLL